MKQFTSSQQHHSTDYTSFVAISNFVNHTTVFSLFSKITPISALPLHGKNTIYGLKISVISHGWINSMIKLLALTRHHLRHLSQNYLCNFCILHQSCSPECQNNMRNTRLGILQTGLSHVMFKFCATVVAKMWRILGVCLPHQTIYLRAWVQISTPLFKLLSVLGF